MGASGLSPPARLVLPLLGKAGGAGQDCREGPMVRMHVMACSKRSLVVNALSQALDGQGHRLTVCESGLEILGAVEVVAPDILVLDMETPGLNGLLLVAAIKELAPDLPIVAVSTRSEADARALAQKGVACTTLPSGADAAAYPLLAALAQIDRGSPVASPQAS